MSIPRCSCLLFYILPTHTAQHALQLGKDEQNVNCQTGITAINNLL